MYKSIILPLAKADIQEAASWYRKHSKTLARKFTKEVRDKVHFIRQNPKASNIRYNKVRTAVLSKFPFMIHYIIDENNMRII